MSNRLAEYEKVGAVEGARWPAGRGGDQNLQRRMASLFNQATVWVKQHPEIALTAAVVAGVMIGWLTKRR